MFAVLGTGEESANKDASRTLHFGCHPREGLESVMRQTIDLFQLEKVKTASGTTLCASWAQECHASYKQSAIQRKKQLILSHLF